ncbi:MAG: hypothetical protein HQ592_07725 [Planctomycetes bacterium]|nr:hypothetical protein [Planctomycetota bacterium]
MNEINKLSRFASGVVAFLNLVALVSPIRADALDMPGGYDLEFVWHQFRWLKRPLNLEILFVVGGAILVCTFLVHIIRVMSKTTMLVWITVAFAAQLVSRMLVDITRVMLYYPPFHHDPWRAFAFIGALACLTSLCIQAAIIVQAFRKKAHNKAVQATAGSARGISSA